MTPEEFEKIVDETLKDLPKEFSKKMENVGIIVEDWPTPQDLSSIRAQKGSLLFGLYRGVPKTKRGGSYQALPDKIVIFAGPILSVSSSAEDAKKRIRDTVLHEIGHHFGLSDQQIYKAQRS